MEHSGFKGLSGFFTRLFLSGGWKRIVHERLAANLEGRVVPCHHDQRLKFATIAHTTVTLERTPRIKQGHTT